MGPDTRPDPRNEKIKWERVDDEVRGAAGGAVKRGRSKTEGGQGPQAEGRGRPADRGRPTERSGIKSRRGRAPREAGAGSGGARVKDELVKALGPPKGNRANERVRDAAHAFERERFDDARILLRPVAEQAPQAPSVRELLGLTYYRLGKWSDAVRELSAFREITKSSEQNPVLADAQRALKRHMEVEALWDELREDSPSPELVTEGRIVMAGSLSDRGKFAEAITLLEKSQRSVKNPKPHHLRQGYVLADIYERVGDVARARELFRWIVTHDPMFADAAERVGSLT